MIPSTINRNSGISAAMTIPISAFLDVGEAVERALQNEDRRVLVDHPGASGAADVVGDQLALDGGGRQPLVPEPNRKVGETREIAGEGAGRLGARALAAVH